jgi:DNA-binding NtrC family response regulator
VSTSVRRVLVVDDEPSMRELLVIMLTKEGYDVLTADSRATAAKALARGPVDMVITDVRLPDGDGMEILRHVKAAAPETAVVVMTAYGTINAAVEATRLGAGDYLVKPFEPDQILLVLRRALEFQDLRAHRRLSLRRSQERFTLANLVARSPKMLEILDLLRELASLDTTVLVHGETGVGKELLARVLHFSGPRRDQPFVAVNCAAIPEELFESELFGHRRGAFTGAVSDHEGVFRAAHGGTLFLDEVSEIPLPLQAKFLRAVQEREVTPIGSTVPVPVDVRLIAATNRDLEGEVRDGRFRMDLFYRLNVVHLVLPPLRDRPDDIAPLVDRRTAAVRGTRRTRQNGRPVTTEGSHSARAHSGRSTLAGPGPEAFPDRALS